jgi:Flp pilus assembly protein TadB
MFRKPVREEDALRLRNVQVGGLLPVLLCAVFFLMTANVYLLFLLLFLLIIGVLLPWILLEILNSHLSLQRQIQEMIDQRDPEPPP